MKVVKKGQVYDGLTGQLVDTVIPEPPPDDIPSIVERYIGLVGRIIGDFDTKTKEKGEDGKPVSLQSRDVNSIVALGRTVAMLQAVEEARISRVGGKAIKEIPTAQLRKLIAASEPAEETPDE